MKRKYKQPKETVSIIFPTTCFKIDRNLLLKYPKTRLGKLILKEEKQKDKKKQKSETLEEKLDPNKQEEKQKEEKSEFYFKENDKFFPQIVEFYKHGIFPLSSINESELLLLYHHLDFWKIKLTPLFETMKKSRMENSNLEKNMVEMFIDNFLERKLLELNVNKTHFDLFFQFYPKEIKKYKCEEKNGSVSLSEIIGGKNTLFDEKISPNFEERLILSSISKNQRIPIHHQFNYQLLHTNREFENLLKSCTLVSNLHPFLSSLYTLVRRQEFIESNCALEKIDGMYDNIINIVMEYIDDEINDYNTAKEPIEKNHLHYTLMLFGCVISGAVLFDEAISKDAFDLKYLPDNLSEERKLNHGPFSESIMERKSKCSENRSHVVKYLEQKGIKATWLEKKVSCNNGDDDDENHYEMTRFNTDGHTYPFECCKSSVYHCETCSKERFGSVDVDLIHEVIPKTIRFLRFSW
jgi:hypothetical protein